MMENNDKLLEEFFADNRHEIADNGFSQRVMHRLPTRSRQLAQIWSICGFTLVVVLFVALDGIHLLGNAILQLLNNLLEHGIAELDIRSMAIAGVVLLFFFYKKNSFDGLKLSRTGYKVKLIKQQGKFL